MRNLKNILITGGCGFIGVNFIRYLFENSDFSGRIINIDKLTYAGNPESLADINERHGGNRYFFFPSDICNTASIKQYISEFNIDTVVHLAAESHVDRSIHGPEAFLKTNVMGTFSLLEAARETWSVELNDSSPESILFHHVSTDEVFGSLGNTGYFTEQTAYDPRSPYSASKASSDHIVRAYHHTYGLPVTISNCSNNYGPYQFPEKLIPLMIMNIFDEKPLPVYGDGKNIRDWLFVEDHTSAIWQILQKGKVGETYLIGGENEWENHTLVQELCAIAARKNGRNEADYRRLITFVKDRPGHDRRYAIDCSKIKRELGWEQSVSFSEGLEKTIDWYREHPGWVSAVKSGAYKEWLERNYSKR